VIRRVEDWGVGEGLPFLRDIARVDEWLLRAWEGMQNQGVFAQEWKVQDTGLLGILMKKRSKVLFLGAIHDVRHEHVSRQGQR
jgi:hypothetical protein